MSETQKSIHAFFGAKVSQDNPSARAVTENEASDKSRRRASKTGDVVDNSPKTHKVAVQSSVSFEVLAESTLSADLLAGVIKPDSETREKGFCATCILVTSVAWSCAAQACIATSACRVKMETLMQMIWRTLMRIPPLCGWCG